MSDIDLQITIPVQKNEKNRKKFFQNFWPPLGLPGYPTSGPPDRISKNPSIKPRVTPLGWPMQNFGQFGPVVSSIEGLRTKKWLRILYNEETCNNRGKEGRKEGNGGREKRK